MSDATSEPRRPLTEIEDLESLRDDRERTATGHWNR